MKNSLPKENCAFFGINFRGNSNISREYTKCFGARFEEQLSFQQMLKQIQFVPMEKMMMTIMELKCPFVQKNSGPIGLQKTFYTNKPFLFHPYL